MKLTTVKYKLSDIGNSERFAGHWQGKLIYVAGMGWFIWDEKRWRLATKGEYIECAKKTVRAMYAEASRCEEEGYRAALADWAASCESEKRLMSMLRLAQSDPRLAVNADQLDADQMILNVENGTIDLRTLKLRPHDPAQLCTKLAPVTYDAAAKCATWLAFLDRIFAQDADLIGYVQRIFGNAITGDATAQILPILWGEGANGKSTLVGAIMAILGDYAGTAADTLLMAGRNEHPCERADLQGKRFVAASETSSTAKFNMAIVKQLTGEPRIKARKMHGNYYEFLRTHKLFLQTNNKPRVSEDSEAVWRRLRLIPFNVIIPEAERDRRLLEKLVAEGSGTLNWLLIGCREWQEQGFGMSDAVADATRAYRAESDPIAGFIEDCCVLGADVTASSGALRSAYETWCKTQGAHPISGKAFAARLTKMQCEPDRNFSGRFWRGVGIVSNAHAEVSDHGA
ncbi:MAG TPA: phage/plasmid primase, P4 family [Phycisphaerae bacterium]|nr:phage/plasmid primase, P4 family [Phycisphaerae bacterium]